MFFSNIGRSLEEEDEIRLVSVGIDIGSSTSHLVFSRLVLERLDDRYVVVAREILHESEVLLTPTRTTSRSTRTVWGPLSSVSTGLQGRIRRHRHRGAHPHRRRGSAPERPRDRRALRAAGRQVRGGERRRWARDDAGRLRLRRGGLFDPRPAGDERRHRGGTSKIAVCEGGEIVDLTAADIGARVICFDEAGRVSRIEEAGRRFASEAGVEISLGCRLTQDERRRIAERMADRLFEAMRGGVASRETSSLLRLPALREARTPETLTFSGGVSEYVYGREAEDFATSVRSSRGPSRREPRNGACPWRLPSRGSAPRSSERRSTPSRSAEARSS